MAIYNDQQVITKAKDFKGLINALPAFAVRLKYGQNIDVIKGYIQQQDKEMLLGYISGLFPDAIPTLKNISPLTVEAVKADFLPTIQDHFTPSETEYLSGVLKSVQGAATAPAVKPATTTTTTAIKPATAATASTSTGVKVMPGSIYDFTVLNFNFPKDEAGNYQARKQLYNILYASGKWPSYFLSATYTGTETQNNLMLKFFENFPAVAQSLKDYYSGKSTTLNFNTTTTPATANPTPRPSIAAVKEGTAKVLEAIKNIGYKLKAAPAGGISLITGAGLGYLGVKWYQANYGKGKKKGKKKR